MADKVLWFPQSSNGYPIKCFDNGDGSYSLGVRVVNPIVQVTTETLTMTSTITLTTTETVTETTNKKDKKDKD